MPCRCPFRCMAHTTNTNQCGPPQQRHSHWYVGPIDCSAAVGPVRASRDRVTWLHTKGFLFYFLAIQGEIKHMHGALIHWTLYIAMQALGATIPQAAYLNRLINHLLYPIEYLSFVRTMLSRPSVLVSAAAGNKSAIRHPIPPPGCGGEWK